MGPLIDRAGPYQLLLATHKGSLQRPCPRNIEAKHPTLPCWFQRNLVTDWLTLANDLVFRICAAEAVILGPRTTIEYRQHEAPPVQLPLGGNLVVKLDAKRNCIGL